MRIPLLQLLVGLLLMVGLARCEDPPIWETDRAMEPICDRLMACGGAGYTDVEECQDGLVANPSLGTACAHLTRYYECMRDACWQGCRLLLSKDDCSGCTYPDCNTCDQLDCATFTAEEQACFEQHCPSD